MKSLITITTCNRLEIVKKFIWDYINFCNKNEGFDFLLALDGTEESYFEFCNSFKIPLLYSEQREGVGLSKNRVLKKFPNYDSYFFIEDDVELIDGNIFPLFTKTSEKTGYPHFCHNHPEKVIKKENFENKTISHSTRGGAQFSFYTKPGLSLIGGWDIFFAKYRRFGHTEHSYRFCHLNLQPAPFIFIEEARKMIIIHSPPHVTTSLNIKSNPETHLILEEETLIKKKIGYIPLATISPFYFNGFPMGKNSFVENFLNLNKKRYPLTKGMEKRIALAEHYFLRIKTTNNYFRKILFFLTSFYFFPLNTPFKHSINRIIGR